MKTSNTKKLSIIIPCYNKWNFTKACLNDLSNIPDSCEIIVVDNGSSDNTEKEIVKFLESMNNLIYVRNNKNIGFGAAVNLGFSKCSGNLVMFLNNDIRISNKSFDWLDDFMEFVNAHENHLIGPTGGYVDCNFNFKYETKDATRVINYISGWCITANYNIWNKLIIGDNVGPFDAKTFFAYFEDTDLGFRAKLVDIDFALYDLPIIHFGKQTSKLLDTYKLYKESKSKFIEKWQ